MEYAIVVAASRDASAIAALHAESWRSAYRGLYPDEFLDGPILEERLLILARTDEQRRIRIAGTSSPRLLTASSSDSRVCCSMPSRHGVRFSTTCT